MDIISDVAPGGQGQPDGEVKRMASIFGTETDCQIDGMET